MDRSPFLLNSNESRGNSGQNGQPETSLVELPRHSDLPVISSGGGHGFSDNSGYLPRHEGDGVNFQQLLAVAFRRWPAMLAVFLAATFLGGVSAITSRPLYQATATIELAAPQRNDAIDIPGLAEILNANNGNSVGTQIEILRGPDLRSKAMKRLDPQTQKVLREYCPVTVSQVGNSNLLSVSVMSYNKDAARQLADAIGQEYEESSKEKNRSNTRDAIKYIEDQLASVQKRMQGAQENLKDFKQRTGIFNISSEGDAMAQQLAGLETALQQTQAERSASAAMLAGLQGKLSSMPRDKQVPSSVVLNPAVASLQSKLSQLELDKLVASKEYAPSSFKIRELDQEIAATKAQLSREAKTTVQAWQPDPERQPLASQAASTQATLWSQDARIKALSGQIEVARKALSKLPEHEFQFSQLSTDAQILQQTYSTLSDNLQKLLISAKGAGPDGTLIFQAGPGAQVGFGKGRIIMYGAAFGLILAFGVALLLDMIDSRIYSDEEAQRVTGLPVLTHVPLLRENQLVSPIEQWQTATHSGQLLESYRLLRANIAFSSIDKPIRTLAVTSSLPSEGKSHTAVNLAIAAATGGDRVILVDLDLRRPTVHRLSQMSNRLGFTSVVGGQCTLEEALQETEIPGLSVLTSGPLPPSPFKILNSRAGRALIEQLGQYADLVVIDAPPVLGMVDARLIASWVDGTVLVISCKDVGRREVSRSTDSLIQGGAELLGTVLSKVPQGVNGTYNYYGYRYNQLNSYYENGGPQEGHDSGDGSTSGLVRTTKDA